MGASCIPAELIDAYRAAQYRVNAVPAFSLRIGQRSEALYRLVREAGAATACFITACNPLGELTDASANAAANVRLGFLLRALTPHLWSATGVDPAGSWPDEPGYLAAGIALAQARELGARFGQNAIVWIERDATPKLVLLR